MDNVSTITSRVEDYNINENDKRAFLKVWNEYINANITERNKAETCRRIIRICKYLQDLSSASLSEWTELDASAFVVWLNSSEQTARNYLRLIKRALEAEGLSTNVLDVKDIKEANEVSKYYPDFETFNALLLSTFYGDEDMLNCSTYINKYATPRAIAYLAWLGLSLVEIDCLRKEDFNEASRCFLFENKVFSYAMYPEMVKFFRAYSSATGFYDTNGVKRKYCDSGLFIRVTRSKGAHYSRFLLGKAIKNTKLSYEQIHYSGMFERLYKYEQQLGRDFNRSDIADIQFIMRTNKDPKEFKRVFPRWMRKYNKYKELRETNSFDLW